MSLKHVASSIFVVLTLSACSNSASTTPNSEKISQAEICRTILASYGKYVDLGLGQDQPSPPNLDGIISELNKLLPNVSDPDQNKFINTLIEDFKKASSESTMIEGALALSADAVQMKSICKVAS